VVVLSGTAWDQLGYGAYVSSPNADELLRDYYLMQAFDPTAGAVTTIITRMICSHLGEYQHDDERLAEWVNAQLDNLEGGWSYNVAQMLTAVWAGVSVLHKRWQQEASEWVYQSLDLLHPLTFCPSLYGYSSSQYTAGGGITLDSKTQTVTEIRQFNTARWEEPVTIPVEECVYWPYAQQFREDTYGNSLFKRARRSWYVKTKIEEFWNIWNEKYAGAWPVVRVPESFKTDPATGEVASTVTWARDFMDNLRMGKGMVYSGGPDDKVDVAMIEAGQGTGGNYDLACKYWQSQLFMACLFPGLLLTEPEHGSRAQAQSMLDFFLLLLEAIRDELDNVIIGQVVQPLIYYNFGEQEDYGRWEWDSLTDADKDALANQFAQVGRTLATFTQVGYSMPEQDEERVREAFPEFMAPISEVSPEAQQAAAAQAQQDMKARAAEARLEAIKQAGGQENEMWQQAEVVRRYSE